MAIDNTAPNETIVKLSSTKPLLENILWTVLMVVFLYSFFIIDSGIRYISLLLFCFFLNGVYQNIKKNKKEPKIQFRLSDKGLTLKKGSLISWSDIKKMEVIVKPNYANNIQKEYLIVKTRRSNREFFINELNISSIRLEYLIKIYRSRYEENIKASKNVVQQHL